MFIVSNPTARGRLPLKYYVDKKEGKNSSISIRFLSVVSRLTSAFGRRTLEIINFIVM